MFFGNSKYFDDTEVIMKKYKKGKIFQIILAIKELY